MLINQTSSKFCNFSSKPVAILCWLLPVSVRPAPENALTLLVVLERFNIHFTDSVSIIMKAVQYKHSSTDVNKHVST